MRATEDQELMGPTERDLGLHRLGRPKKKQDIQLCPREWMVIVARRRSR